jgi:hypothetical protein
LEKKGYGSPKKSGCLGLSLGLGDGRFHWK